jgi:glycosyltransferase involved in cell wall biosynthesis
MVQNKTIIIFSTAYIPLQGGAELAIKDITNLISDYTFILITARIRSEFPARERIGNVEVVRAGIGFPFLDKLWLIIAGPVITRRIMKKQDVCLFWGVMASFASMVPAILKFARRTDTPFLVTLQEGDAAGHIARARFGLVGFGWRFILRQADHVQVISSYLDSMARAYGYAGNITLVPNGVDMQKQRAQHREYEAREKKVIISVSRLVQKNGIDTLLRAFAEVHKTFPLAELHLVGDGPLRAELEVLARLLKIEKFVVFTGEAPHERIAEYYAAADIFVRPSRSEGLGTAFLEAMANGLPIIGTPVGGIVDFLRNGETGLVCRVDDPHDLAENITMLFNDALLYSKLRTNGRQLVEEYYNWNRIAERMKTIFNDLCAL